MAPLSIRVVFETLSGEGLGEGFWCDFLPEAKAVWGGTPPKNGMGPLETNGSALHVAARPDPSAGCRCQVGSQETGPKPGLGIQGS